jgi:type I restriction enzyme S subunit
MSDQLPLGFERHDAPTDWRIVSFTEALQVNPHRPMPKGAMCAFLDMAAVKPDGRGVAGYDWREASSPQDTRFQDGDVLFAKISPGCDNGKVALIRDLPTPVGLASKEFHVLSAIPEHLSPEYLFLLACSPPLRAHAVSYMTGATERRRVPPEAFRGDRRVALPSLGEQREIVAVVRTADEALDRAEVVSDALQRVRRGVTRRLLGRGLGRHEFVETEVGRLPADWRVATIGDLTEVTSGWTPDRHRPECGEGGTLAWLRSGKVNDRLIRGAGEFVTPEALAASRSSLLPVGTLLVALRGQGRTRGRAALLGIEACISEDLAAILPNPELDTRFLFHWFDLHYEDIHGGERGTVPSTLNRRIIERTPVPVPPGDEQRAIVERLDAVEAAVQRSLEEVERLSEVRRGLIRDLLTGRVRVRTR